MSHQASGSYAFTAKPRAVGSSKRFRKPGLTLMSDRRVIRGTTHKPAAIPSSAVSTYDPTSAKQQQLRDQRRYIPPTKKTIFDLKPEQEDHIPVRASSSLALTVSSAA